MVQFLQMHQARIADLGVTQIKCGELGEHMDALQVGVLNQLMGPAEYGYLG